MKSRTRRINNQRGGVVLWALLILGIVWILLILLGMRGWGYASYYGSRVYIPAVRFFSSANYYDNPSLRSGSVRGTSVRGGGPSVGK